jgi:hypothetical protein
VGEDAEGTAALDSLPHPAARHAISAPERRIGIGLRNRVASFMWLPLTSRPVELWVNPARGP